MPEPPRRAPGRTAEVGINVACSPGILTPANYLTTLGRPARADLDILAKLKMPIKALSATL